MGGGRNIRELIKWARDYLASKGVQSPRLVAELLAEEVTKKHRIYFYLGSGVSVSRKQKAFFEKNIKLCGRKVPLAYVIGKQYFMGDLFFIRPGVFIPRPETEILVEKALQFLENIKKDHLERSLIVADIGTGSGNIAISIAKRVKNVFIYATDISSLALKVAEKNALFHGVSQRISFLFGDLFSPLEQKNLEEKFDLIVSNPPYIEKEQLRYLPEEVRKEPVFALNGGKKGLDFYKRIIPTSKKWLKENGALMLEIGYNQAEEVKQIIKKEYSSFPQFFCDLEGNRRVVFVQEKCSIELLKRQI